jgi:hypothetical protein
MKKITALFLFSFIFVATLPAQTPQYYNYQVVEGTNYYPFGVTGGKECQWLYPAGNFNTPTSAPSGNITKIYFYMGYTNGNATLSHLLIKLGQTTLTDLPAGVIYTGQLDTVYYRASVNLISVIGQWMEFDLDTPFPYDSTKSLIVDVSQCGATNTSVVVCQHTYTGRKRCYINGTTSCVFTYSGQDATGANFGVDIETLPAAPPYYNYMTTGSNNSFPFGIATGKMVQWLIPPAAQTGGWSTPNPPLPGGMINAVYVWIGSSYQIPPTTYNNFEVLMGQTNLTNLTTGQFYNGTMDTVLYRATMPLTGPLNSWMLIPLDAPFPYDPTMGTVLQIGQCNANISLTYPACQTSIGGIKRVWSVGGCPFTPYTLTSDGYVIHTGINVVYPTGTSSNENQVPGVYKLEQNYPNPFNPVTNISYSIPKAGNVKLAVYDVLGREIASLVNEYKTAGNYMVSFNAENLASGLYMYKIESGNFVDTKKMMLVK